MTQEEQTYATRRAATRASVGKPVQLHFDDSIDILEGVCDNISIGGMFVELDPPRPPETLVRFELPVENGSICGLGEVVWMRTESLGKGRATGIGIKFRHLEQRDRQLIFKLVSEHIKERLARRQALTAPFALPEPELRRAEASRRAQSTAARSTVEFEDKARHGSASDDRAPNSAFYDRAPDDGPLDKTLQHAKTTRGAETGQATETFDLPLGESEAVDKTLQRPVQASLFEPSPAASDPLDKTIYHGSSPENEELDNTLARPGEQAAYSSSLFAPEEAVDKTLQHASRPDHPAFSPEPEAEELEGLDRTLSRSTRIDAARRSKTPRRWLLPGLVLLLLVLVISAFLLRGAWSGEDATPGTEAPVSAPEAVSEPESASPQQVSTTPRRTSDPSPPVTQPTEKKAPPTDVVSQAVETTPPPTQDRPGPTSGSNASFSRLTDITWNRQGESLQIVITGDGRIPASRYKHFRLGGESGPREVIQLFGVKKGFGDKVIMVDSPQIRQIRTGYHRKSGGNELHVVLDLKAARYRVREISNRGTRLEIRVD